IAVTESHVFQNCTLVVIRNQRAEEDGKSGDRGSGVDLIQAPAAEALLPGPLALHGSRNGQPGERTEEGVEIKNVRLFFQGDLRDTSQTRNTVDIDHVRESSVSVE